MKRMFKNTFKINKSFNLIKLALTEQVKPAGGSTIIVRGSRLIMCT